MTKMKRGSTIVKQRRIKHLKEKEKKKRKK